MPMQIAKRNPVDYDVVKMVGGWDQLTPTLSLAPGALRDVLSAPPGQASAADVPAQSKGSGAS